MYLFRRRCIHSTRPLFLHPIEHGPFYVTEQLELKKRSTAWSLPYNVLYIDQPVGTGFSFTKNELGYATNQEMVANDLYEAMKQFYTMFPDLLDEDFYVTGESYAGKYVLSLHTLQIFTFQMEITSIIHPLFRGLFSVGAMGARRPRFLRSNTGATTSAPTIF